MNNKKAYAFLDGVDPEPINPYKMVPPKQEPPPVQEDRKKKPTFNPKEKKEPPKQYVNILPQSNS